GDTILNPGMYQVQHVAEGGDHVIIFKEVGMAAGYKMGNTPVGKEVARVRCNVEPVAKAATNTKSRCEKMLRARRKSPKCRWPERHSSTCSKRLGQRGPHSSLRPPLICFLCSSLP